MAGRHQENPAVAPTRALVAAAARVSRGPAGKAGKAARTGVSRTREPIAGGRIRRPVGIGLPVVVVAGAVSRSPRPPAATSLGRVATVAAHQVVAAKVAEPTRPAANPAAAHRRATADSAP